MNHVLKTEGGENESHFNYGLRLHEMESYQTRDRYIGSWEFVCILKRNGAWEQKLEIGRLICINKNRKANKPERNNMRLPENSLNSQVLNLSSKTNLGLL